MRVQVFSSIGAMACTFAVASALLVCAPADGALRIICACVGPFAAYCIYICAVAYAYGSTRKPVPTKRIPTHAIVLGCRVLRNGRPGQYLTNRITALCAYYANVPLPQIIVCSGGQGADEPRTEASAIREVLLERGIPASIIREEDQSLRTLENLRFSARYIPQGSSVVVASSTFHLLRVRVLAQRAGLGCVELVGAPSPPVKLSLFLFNWAREVLAIMRACPLIDAAAIAAIGIALAMFG